MRLEGLVCPILVLVIGVCKKLVDVKFDVEPDGFGDWNSENAGLWKAECLDPCEKSDRIGGVSWSKSLDTSGNCGGCS
ncbi:hypothetical protein WICPIJ_002035 [Wickerhamomyces pijperi]|uniref:Uncharacterized protein n=1 Tax=Wickerhamomyces pijperi TaxID=599730 RepID=A0A9P8QC66_WICPI|nr:hypothetical protein WICPIJ_002035 [Wickerhamomyces pijperi]